MKKTFIVITGLIVAGILFSSMSMAWQPEKMGQGHMNSTKMQERSENYREFMQNSTETREQLAKDRVQMRTLMSQENPDSEKVEELRDRIRENKNKLREMAESHNVTKQHWNKKMRRHHGKNQTMGSCWGQNQSGSGQGSCW